MLTGTGAGNKQAGPACNTHMRTLKQGVGQDRLYKLIQRPEWIRQAMLGKCKASAGMREPTVPTRTGGGAK